jgi:hypothetical protein
MGKYNWTMRGRLLGRLRSFFRWSAEAAQGTGVAGDKICRNIDGEGTALPMRT